MPANAVVLVLGGYQISIATYLRGGIYPHIKFDRDPLNIFRVRALTSSGSTGRCGRGDAKTIISANTSFGDIIRDHVEKVGKIRAIREMLIKVVKIRKIRDQWQACFQPLKNDILIERFN